MAGALRALGREGQDARIRELLHRARRWHDSARHHEAIDALARKVLTARDASCVSAPGWTMPESQASSASGAFPSAAMGDGPLAG